MFDIKDLEIDITTTRNRLNKTLDLNGCNWVQKLMLETYITELEDLHYKIGVKTNDGVSTYT